MKTNYIPAIVMLLAGAVYCLFGLKAQIPLLDFTVQLLIVLLVFYILGGIVRMVLDRFMGDIEVKSDKEDDAESSEEQAEEEQNEAVKASDDEEGM
ncbi:MAG: hypothetical protein IJ419_13255 [Agathobacter sp.]|nr:hypothetical protein [Agathobacter sp.]